MSDDIRGALQEVLPGVLADLDALIRIPSVSSDPAAAGHVSRSAALTSRLFRASGGSQVDVKGGQPAVVARYPAPPDAPTVPLYEHHDVQPASAHGVDESLRLREFERACPAEALLLTELAE